MHENTVVRVGIFTAMKVHVVVIWVLIRGTSLHRAVIVQSVYRLGYELNDRGSRFRFSAVAGNFSLYHRFQNCSVAHPASYPVGTRGSFPGGKAAGA
jgi:hypothetical protein